MTNSKETKHNKAAPYWAILLVVSCSTGLATIWIDLGSFWKGYVLDMTGPAWNYILFRGLFTSYTENLWTKFFSPIKTFLIFLFVCFSIEGTQYLQWYNATYDPFDILAYISILLPLFLFDSYKKKNQ